MIDSLIWLVPLVVLAAGVWRPRAGLVAFTAALPLFGAPPGGPYLTAFDAAALAAIVTAWRAGRAPRSAVDRPLAAFVVVSLASMLPLAYQPPSWRPRVFWGLLEVLPNVQSWAALHTWRAALNLILGWLLYLAVRRAFAHHSLRPLGLALAGGLATSLLAGLAARTELIELWTYRPIGGRLWDPRLHSLFFHSGWLAEYLVLASPIAVAAVLARRTRARVLGALLAAGTLVALILTLQRGAWVAVIVQVALAALILGRGLRLDRRRRRRLALAAAAAVVVVASIPLIRPQAVAPFQQRLIEEKLLSGRTQVWKVAAEMTAERPLLGWGLGGFVPAFDLRAERFPGAIHWLTPHNHYLMLSAERGLLGLTSFALLVWALARSLARSQRREDGRARLLGRGLIVAFAGFAVYGLVQYFFFLKMIEWLFWILVAAATALAPGEPSRRADRLALALAAVALVLVPLRLWRTAAIASPSAASYGFHRAEASEAKRFVWTERRAARRVPWEGETLVLELANGHPRAGERPLEVVVSVDGQVRARLTLHGGWEEHRIVLGAPKRPWVVIGLETRPVFRPFREFRRHQGLERSRDIRQLGVALGDIRWEGPAVNP